MPIEASENTQSKHKIIHFHKLKGTYTCEWYFRTARTREITDEPSSINPVLPACTEEIIINNECIQES